MVFTVSLRMNERIRMSELRMKLACVLAELCHATCLDASIIRTSDILAHSFILGLAVNTINILEIYKGPVKKIHPFFLNF